MVASILFNVPLVCRVGSPHSHLDGKPVRESGFRPVCVLSMGVGSLDAGHRRKLTARIKNVLASSAIAASLVAGSLVMLGSPLVAGGETRTISLHHVHTNESLTVTYMVNGRYVPSAMKQINYLLRDWRRKVVITIDPRTIDLAWELHEDLGSQRPINIICGYRSPQTNAFLHRIGRNVAKKSQHMAGKAIDLYFPDVPLVKIRNSALVRKLGGVGYYPSSNFVHLDSGSVRHWGPYISNSQWAQIFREGSKTLGRRLRSNSGNETDSAPEQSSGGGLFAAIGKLVKGKPAEVVNEPIPAQPEQIPVEAAYEGSDGDMADLSADAAVAPVKPQRKQGATAAPADQLALGDLAQDAAQSPPVQKQVADNGEAEPLVKQGYPVPRPRLKPPEIMLMAAANIKADQKLIRITAASAEPPDQSGRDKPSPVAGSLATMMAAVAVDDETTTLVQTPNKNGKSSFAAELRSGTTDDAPLIKPLLASAGGSDINWWPQLLLNGEATLRRDGAPTLIGTKNDTTLPVAAKLSAESDTSANAQAPANGKGDLLVVNREGKGNLEMPIATTGKPQKLSSN
jgi:uncharacterized protein YcbK (DUF882 family)